MSGVDVWVCGCVSEWMSGCVGGCECECVGGKGSNSCSNSITNAKFPTGCIYNYVKLLYNLVTCN